jgi:hypothetical protein
MLDAFELPADLRAAIDHGNALQLFRRAGR